jgi:site-specific DNA-methyltransferase (adenine-specific)
LNIDASRVGRAEGDDSVAGSRTATFGTQETASGGDGSGGWEQNTGGRWPANVIHDGSDEVVELFPTNAGGGHWAKTKVTGYGEFGGGKSEYFGQGEKDGKGSAARFFYCAKASKRDRNEGLDGFEIKETQGGGGRPLENYGEDEDSQRLKQAATAYNAVKAAKANHHPTVKPTELMRYLCRLVTPPSGIVLDPFMGSGSTGKAAMYEGFEFVGIELTDEYLPIAKARIEFAIEEMKARLL